MILLSCVSVMGRRGGVGAQNSLAYATRVRTIKNDVTKNEANKEILKLKKQIDYWKEQVLTACFTTA